MTDTLFLLAALIVSVVGIGCFALSIEPHWRQVTKVSAVERPVTLSLRFVGAVLLAASFLLCVAADPVPMAALVWPMLLTVAAVIVAMSLSRQAALDRAGATRSRQASLLAEPIHRRIGLRARATGATAAIGLRAATESARETGLRYWNALALSYGDLTKRYQEDLRRAELEARVDRLEAALAELRSASGSLRSNRYDATGRGDDRLIIVGKSGGGSEQ